MKKIFKIAAVNACLLVGATVASAQDINMFGASAQFNYWNDYAQTFLQTNLGCSNVTKLANGSKLGGYMGTGCTNWNSQDVTVRYTSISSIEGVFAVQEKNLSTPMVDAMCGSDPQNFPDRKQVTTTNGTACMDVHVGSSDVSPDAFTQVSDGGLNGLFDRTSKVSNLPGLAIPKASTFTTKKSVIVPFGFFAHKSLVEDPTKPITSLNRNQTVLLFSGNVADYSWLGADFPEKRVGLCLRHAGSGTHATLDKAIMRGDYGLPTAEQTEINPDPIAPLAFFHESSSDAMKCINQNGKTGQYLESEVGFIGYLDADAIVDRIEADGTETRKSDAANVRRLLYNGLGEGMSPANWSNYNMSGLKHDILAGTYEFWSAQWLFMKKTDYTNTTGGNYSLGKLFDRLAAYASANPMSCATQMPDPLAPGVMLPYAKGKYIRGCYWIAPSEITLIKESDSTLPRFNPEEYPFIEVTQGEL